MLIARILGRWQYFQIMQVCLIVGWLIGGVSSAALGQSRFYRVEDVSPPDAMGVVQASGINDAGQVIGFYATVPPYYADRAFIYTDGSGTQVLPLPPFDDHCLKPASFTGEAINNSSQAVGLGGVVPICPPPSGCIYCPGGAADGDPPILSYGAFLYSDGMTQFLPIRRGEAYGINRRGQVTGGAASSSYIGTFRYTTGALEFLTSSASWGRSINDDGDVAGYFYGGTYQAFLYTDDGGLELVSPGVANGINTFKQVVGGTCGGLGCAPQNAFRYSRGKLEILGPGAAKAINDCGVVVGESGGHAFLYANAEEGMLDLNTLIAPGSGWVLQSATGINSVGQVVGYGTFNGAQKAFRLTPTCPSTPGATCPKGCPKAIDAQAFLPLGPALNSEIIGNKYRVDFADDPYRTTADGVSRIVLQLDKLPTAGSSVMFSMVSSDIQANGGFAKNLTDAPQQTVTVTYDPVSQVPGIKRAAVVYVPPQNFSADSSHTLINTRNVNFQIDSQTHPIPIALHRPPVIFVHGLFSDRGTWNNAVQLFNQGQTYAPGDLLALDYSSNNRTGFDKVFKMVPQEIGATINIGRRTRLATRSRIATTQVDVVAHSQGGLLTRWFISNITAGNTSRSQDFMNRMGSQCTGNNNPCIIYTMNRTGDFYPNVYARDLSSGPDLSNFNKGDIRRFITMGTPYVGSHVANNVVRGGCFTTVSAVLGNGDMGALDDLSVGSPFLRILNSSDQSIAPLTHAIYTTGGTDGTCVWAALCQTPCFSLLPDCSDRIVSLDSQQGATQTSRYDNISHTSQTGNSNTIQRAKDLLTQPGMDSQFGPMRVPSISTPCCPSGQDCSAR